MTATQTFFQSGPEDYPQLDWNNYTVRAVQHDARPWPPAPADIKSILVIKLDAYGDHVLHTPFYKHLRKFYPHAKITLLCHQINVKLAEHNPAFNHVIGSPIEPGFDQGASFLFAMELQNHAAAPFDLVIVPRWSEDWHHGGVIAQVLDAPYRLSYAANTVPYKIANFPQHDDYFTHVIDDARPTHDVMRGMQMLHALGMQMPPISDIRMRIYPGPDDNAKVDALLAGQNLPRPWVGLGVGASGEFKCWPATHFAALAEKIIAATNGTVFVFGYGAKDEAALAIIQAKNLTNIFNAVGKLSARESAVLIGRCDAMVCNDSFTMHAAAAHNVPIAEVLCHPADGNPDSEHTPNRFGPWGPPFAYMQPLTCNGSLHPMESYLREPKCIADVPPDDVFKALEEVMHRWPK